MTGNWVRVMQARQPTEEHRSATPLELFYDLCFVVAVALAASGMHHALTEGHVGAGVLGYLLVFFAIWWAWDNFTAFASAYDTDDGLYRLTTVVQILGALVLAAGVPAALDRRDYLVVTLGYVIMRLAMVAQWLRAARADPPRRACALRFALGITVVQVGWVSRLALPPSWGLVSFLVMVAAELVVPIWAQRYGPTTWNPEHLAERYGLFTLIVLGEVVLATTSAIQHSLSDGEHLGTLLGLAAAGVVIVFAMWWLYFDRPAGCALDSLRTTLAWSYGHYPIFASVAAVGAGLEVAVDFDTGHTALGPLAAGWATAVPVAAYVLAVWLVRIRGEAETPRWVNVACPLTAALILASPFTHAPVHVTAVLLTALVVARAVRG